MKSTLEILDSISSNITVSIPEDTVQSITTSAIKRFTKHAKIPGFRPGMAPAEMVKKSFLGDILKERDTQLMKAAYNYVLEQAKEQHTSIVSLEYIKGLDTISLDIQPLELIFKSQNLPSVRLPNYKEIPLNKESIEVSEAEIDAELFKIQKQMAQYELTDAPACSGDYLKVSYVGSLEDGTLIKDISTTIPTILGSQTNTWEEAGAKSTALSELNQALIGLKATDSVRFAHTFDSEFITKELAGKSAMYDLEVVEVRKCILPQLNDTFAQKLKFETIELLRSQILQSLQVQKKQASYQSMLTQISIYFETHTQFEVPSAYLETIIEELIVTFVERIQRQGQSAKWVKDNTDIIYKQASEAALKEAKLRILLEKIAKLETLEITTEDISRAIYSEASSLNKKPQDIISVYKKDASRATKLRQTALRNKTLDFLIQSATLAENKPEVTV